MAFPSRVLATIHLLILSTTPLKMGMIYISPHPILPSPVISTQTEMLLHLIPLTPSIPLPNHLHQLNQPYQRGGSIAHEHISTKKAVYLSLDIETGGENCGILQLSADISKLKIHLTGTSEGKDTMTDIRRDATTFNKYVNPGINEIWSDVASAVHVLHSRDPIIVSAASMPSLWDDFCTWVTGTKHTIEVVIVVA